MIQQQLLPLLLKPHIMYFLLMETCVNLSLPCGASVSQYILCQKENSVTTMKKIAARSDKIEAPFGE